jgi:hypothetical protein
VRAGKPLMLVERGGKSQRGIWADSRDTHHSAAALVGFRRTHQLGIGILDLFSPFE